VDKRIEALDALRAYAAGAVMLLHIFALNAIKLPDYLSGIVPHFGLGVELFFTLSAFCLCLGYFEKLQDGASIRRFLKRRFFRIAPLFYMLLPVWVAIMYFKFDQSFSPATMLLNATFLFNLVPGEQSGIVWASWSIGVEMLFYALFPLCVMFLTNTMISGIATAVAIILATQFKSVVSPLVSDASFVNMSFFTMLPFFLAGITAFHVWKRLLMLTERKQRLVGNALLLSVIGWWLLLAVSGLGSLYLIGAAFPVLILSQVVAPNYLISNPLTVYLGTRGYSLYLLHPIVVLGTMPFVQTVIYDNHNVGTQELTPLLLSWALVYCLTSTASIITYRWIEIPFYAFSSKRGASDSIPAVSIAAPNS
jgi:peptidoglycan/LPS O-acetylase OafA/YrhL